MKQNSNKIQTSFIFVFHRSSEKEILNQTDFVMMDSTSPNLEVIESVSNLTLGDLGNVPTGLSGIQENPNVETQLLPTNSESFSESIKKQLIFEYGEHVACAWYDDGLNCLR